jgi:hypothetical protein
MLESDADRLASIKGLGGQLVRTEGGEFWAIFDDDFKEMADGLVESRGPALTLRLIEAAPLRKGASLDVAGTMYKVLRVEPEASTGFATVRLGKP